MITVNAMGENCPIPVIKTQKVIDGLTSPEEIEVLVDNEVAVQNLIKLAGSRNCAVHAEKKSDAEYRVVISVEEAKETALGTERETAEEAVCVPDGRKDVVVVVSSAVMGEGSEELGKILMKGFLYSLTQMEQLPKTILFYNGGASITCEGSESLEDLKLLEAQGVEILTCGTCLNYYGLTEKLQVGTVTNMYVITQKMSEAGLIVKP